MPQVKTVGVNCSEFRSKQPLPSVICSPFKVNLDMILNSYLKYINSKNHVYFAFNHILFHFLTSTSSNQEENNEIKSDKNFLL